MIGSKAITNTLGSSSGGFMGWRWEPKFMYTVLAAAGTGAWEGEATIALPQGVSKDGCWDLGPYDSDGRRL
jgi:hypothetical protein